LCLNTYPANQENFPVKRKPDKNGNIYLSWCRSCHSLRANYGREEYFKNRYKNDPEKWQHYHQENREKILEQQRKNHEKNKLERNARHANWIKQNAAHVNAYNSQKRANKFSAEVSEADINKIAEYYKMARSLSLQYHIQFDVDHIQPLTRGGKHHPDNLQIITHDDNNRKYNRLDLHIKGIRIDEPSSFAYLEKKGFRKSE
jgi:hypothetical protein